MAHKSHYFWAFTQYSQFSFFDSKYSSQRACEHLLNRCNASDQLPPSSKHSFALLLRVKGWEFHIRIWIRYLVTVDLGHPQMESMSSEEHHLEQQLIPAFVTRWFPSMRYQMIGVKSRPLNLRLISKLILGLQLVWQLFFPLTLQLYWYVHAIQQLDFAICFTWKLCMRRLL